MARVMRREGGSTSILATALPAVAASTARSMDRRPALTPGGTAQAAPVHADGAGLAEGAATPRIWQAGASDVAHGADLGPGGPPRRRPSYHADDPTVAVAGRALDDAPAVWRGATGVWSGNAPVDHFRRVAQATGIWSPAGPSVASLPPGANRSAARIAEGDAAGLPRPPSSQPRPLDTLPRPLAAEPAQAAPRQQEPWRRQPAPATPIGVATPSPPEEGDEAIGLPPALTRDAAHAPFCDAALVGFVCDRLSHDRRIMSATDLSARLQVSDTFMATVFQAMDIDVGRDWIDCPLLCQRALEFCMQRRDCHLPPSKRSDEACFAYGAKGTLECGLDVRPHSLQQDLAATVIEHFPDLGVHGLAEASGDGTGINPSPGHHSDDKRGPIYRVPEDAILRILNMFRIFPAQSATGATYAPNMDEDAIRTLARAEAAAAALASSVLDAMPTRPDAALLEWFRGSGRSLGEVKRRVSEVLGVAGRELRRGFIYVYPPSSVRFKNECGDENTLGFVVREGSDARGQTTAPICTSRDEAFERPCGINQFDRLFVYLCRGWGSDAEDPARVTALFHLALHHAGVRDYTYGVDGLEALKAHANAVDNTANYEYYARAVLDEAMAAPMCSNGQPPVSTYRCGGRACLCEELSASLCDIDAAFRDACRVMCGSCPSAL